MKQLLHGIMAGVLLLAFFLVGSSEDPVNARSSLETDSFSGTGVVIKTATVRSNGPDGWILELSENASKGGILNSTDYINLGDDILRNQYRSILSFPTGVALPDNAVLTKVTLKLRYLGIVGGGNPVAIFQGFMMDIKKGTFGTVSLQLTDWQAAADKTIGPFSPPRVGGWYTFDLTSIRAYINKLATLSGVTQIRLRFFREDDDNFAANFLKFYSGNHLVPSRPTLIIEYQVP
jgi:hypothetical protein